MHFYGSEHPLTSWWRIFYYLLHWGWLFPFHLMLFFAGKIGWLTDQTIQRLSVFMSSCWLYFCWMWKSFLNYKLSSVLIREKICHVSIIYWSGFMRNEDGSNLVSILFFSWNILFVDWSCNNYFVLDSFSGTWLLCISSLMIMGVSVRWTGYWNLLIYCSQSKFVFL